MRVSALAAACLLTAFAVPVDASPEVLGMTSPAFVGVVAHQDTNTHHYQNMADGMNCIQIVRPYTVTVATSETVRVAVGSHSMVVSSVGSMTFQSGVCTAFDIVVEGIGDGDSAYAIDVQANQAGQLVEQLGPAIVCNIC